MKVLIASTPALGHLNPMLAMGRILLEEGHDVAGLSSNAMRQSIEAAGLKFYAFPKGADFDLRNMDAEFPELRHIPAGPEMTRFYMENTLIGPIPSQHDGLKRAIDDFGADVVLGDDFMFGALPMLLGPRAKRPPIILCGTMILHYLRDDGAPSFAGFPPATSEAQINEYRAVADQHETYVYAPVRKQLNDILAGYGVGPIALNAHDASVELSDIYLQLTVPSFEFPRRKLPSTVRFLGTLPIVKNQASLPSWAADLDGSKKVVLVSQGTVSNFDFGRLIAPTFEALADEKDLLVVATTGGRSIDTIPGTIPLNARVATYLPFEWLLPEVSAFVTNGGYGTVNQALSRGIPIVGAGLTEDKADVNARISWSGVGVDLLSDTPTPDAIRDAVRKVINEPSYRMRARILQGEYASIDTRHELLRAIEDVRKGSFGL